MNKANSFNKIMLIADMSLPAAVAGFIHICISFYFDLGLLARMIFGMPHDIILKILIVAYSYMMVWLLSVIAVYPVWHMLQMFDKLTLANLCFACAVLGICYPMVAYFIAGNKNMVMLLLYRPEVIMSYLLPAVVFAMVLWWYVYGSKHGESANIRDAEADGG